MQGRTTTPRRRRGRPGTGFTRRSRPGSAAGMLKSLKIESAAAFAQRGRRWADARSHSCPRGRGIGDPCGDKGITPLWMDRTSATPRLQSPARKPRTCGMTAAGPTSQGGSLPLLVARSKALGMVTSITIVRCRGEPPEPGLPESRQRDRARRGAFQESAIVRQRQPDGRDEGIRKGFTGPMCARSGRSGRG
jgi:hypothetical protein